MNTLKPDLGTYAQVTYDNDSIDQLYDWMIKNNIPNLIPKHELHTTVVYSRRPVNIVSCDLTTVNCSAVPDELDTWAQSDGTYCLVLKLKSEDLVRMHNGFKKMFGATFDFDTYTPHITLSYDVGANFDLSNIVPFSDVTFNARMFEVSPLDD